MNEMQKKRRMIHKTKVLILQSYCYDFILYRKNLKKYFGKSLVGMNQVELLYFMARHLSRESMEGRTEDFKDVAQSLWMSRAYISQETGLNQNRITDSMRDLEKAGMLVTVQVPGKGRYFAFSEAFIRAWQLYQNDRIKEALNEANNAILTQPMIGATPPEIGAPPPMIGATPPMIGPNKDKDKGKDKDKDKETPPRPSPKGKGGVGKKKSSTITKKALAGILSGHYDSKTKSASIQAIIDELCAEFPDRKQIKEVLQSMKLGGTLIFKPSDPQTWVKEMQQAIMESSNAIHH